MPRVALLGPLDALLAASKAHLSSNLVPLSPPSSVNLPLLAPSCALTSQLGAKIGPNLPSKLIFHQICDPPNLHFCNTNHEISRVIEDKKVPIIGSFDFLKTRIGPSNKNWSITSDSISLLISEELQLNTLLIVKSCLCSFVDSKIALNQIKVNKLVSLGILDASFSLNFQNSKTKVYLFFRDQLPNVSDIVLSFSKPSKRNQ